MLPARTLYMVSDAISLSVTQLFQSLCTLLAEFFVATLWIRLHVYARHLSMRKWVAVMARFRNIRPLPNKVSWSQGVCGGTDFCRNWQHRHDNFTRAKHGFTTISIIFSIVWKVFMPIQTHLSWSSAAALWAPLQLCTCRLDGKRPSMASAWVGTGTDDAQNQTRAFFRTPVPQYFGTLLVLNILFAWCCFCSTCPPSTELGICQLLRRRPWPPLVPKMYPLLRSTRCTHKSIHSSCLISSVNFPKKIVAHNSQKHPIIHTLSSTVHNPPYQLFQNRPAIQSVLCKGSESEKVKKQIESLIFSSPQNYSHFSLEHPFPQIQIPT